MHTFEDLFTIHGPILLAIAIAVGITFAWRLIGMLSVGKMSPEHPLVVWATTVAFATVAALTIKLMFFSSNETLAGVALHTRLIAATATLFAFFLLKRNFILATLVGMATFLLVDFVL